MTDVLQGQAKPGSPEFRENRDHHLQTIDEIAAHVAAAKQGGGEEGGFEGAREFLFHGGLQLGRVWRRSAPLELGGVLSFRVEFASRAWFVWCADY